MDSRSNIPAPSCSVEPLQGHLERRGSGFVDGRPTRVGRKPETRSARMRGNPSSSRLESTGKKSLLGSCRTSVP